MIRRVLREFCARFPLEYWRVKDEKRAYPEEFVQELMQTGWMGINIPIEYGGAGYGITEASIVLEELSASGGGLSAAGAAHASFFNVTILTKYGNEICKRFLPSIARGELRFQALAITEQGAGFDTPRISTLAVKRGGEYIINGRKVWISRVKHSDLMLLVARTTPYDEVKKRTDGITLFLVDLRKNKDSIFVREIPNNVRRMVDTNELIIEELAVPEEYVIGEVGRGFYHLLEVINAERIEIAAECVGLGRYVIKRAVEYAKNRVVFDRPIGMNQAIAHPLSDAYMRIEAADLMRYRAAWLYDSDQPCGAEANMAKYLAAEACYHACDRAVQTFGGNGLSAETDIERYWRESRLYILAPISQEMVLNYLSHNVLGLPKSY
ncbi:MAG: acyl-CoA/acyl-ACP dehydrogenase [Candidatus Caldarchaeum sp.]|nr:acyl-CoA/acyl-ACP dehydrogenase [Candidatus Caldarchaeum sp.]MDW8435276.1 acyl-CoA dehydrogenase family protein [Candidatus Caldarchaeum sp.]